MQPSEFDINKLPPKVRAMVADALESAMDAADKARSVPWNDPGFSDIEKTLWAWYDKIKELRLKE